ncbi:Hypothetical predicted protein [Podarcis lilfordi]|uniref:Uncharacterized protein n=1 Tax=Podarcis lilfordi TaxID=74358 RepID=A0AA35PB22_9SAUR|nr:Hypothetical predicted protein [Podarcis lilfordi]
MNLSLLGRIGVIKMNILPKVFFLFQSVLVISSAACFKKWQKDITKFIWKGKKPRIKHKLLMDIKDSGGFSLPDFKLYYEAACIAWIWDWIKLENTDILELKGHDNRFRWHAY